MWDVKSFPDVTTSWVKLVVESEYSNSENGFKEIEFYHNNCNRGKRTFQSFSSVVALNETDHHAQ